MLKKPSVIYVVIAVVALSVGALVYLLDRQPEHTYLLGLIPAHAPYSLFGVAGNYLPALLHVYAFILLTAAVAGTSNARLGAICAAWFVITALFEFGQHPAVAPLIAASLPAWFAHIPLLDNTAAYFLRGTFDPLDILAIFLGTAAAGLTVALTTRRAGPRQPDRPRHGAWRRLAFSGAMAAGMLGIVGSGGSGESNFIPGSGDLSKLYVSGNASDALLIYDAANSVTGNIPASRTVEGAANTTLDEPRSIAVDMARNLVYVANTTGNSILVFGNARTMTGDIAPARSISNTVTPISPTGLFIDPVNDRLYVTSRNSVLVYDNASSLDGDNVTPARTLTAGSTMLSAPTGIFVDTTRDLLYVANGDNTILVFENASTVNGGATGPARTILISSSIAGVFVDVMADRLYVSNTGANSIFIFDDASSADGVESHRVISASLNEPRDIFVDTGTGRLYVANAVNDTVLVFNNASTTNNPLAPARVLNLPAFTDPWGIYVDVTPVVIGSTASRDGYVLDDGSVNTDPVNDGPKTGDVEDEVFLGSRQVARQFYSFELTGIPSTINVLSATLRLYQANVVGSPYGAGNLGSVIVDHVNYDTVLESADYNAVALTANIGTLSTDVVVTYKTLDVTSSVASDVLVRSRSQYRLRFSQENSTNADNDYVQFTDAEDSCCAANKPPQLVITVRP